MIEGSRRAEVLRRIAGACGITSQLVGLTVLLVAISNSPWFSWTENDISVLGVGVRLNKGIELSSKTKREARRGFAPSRTINSPSPY